MGELHRERLGFALRQVEQDAGDVIGLVLEIDAGDDVGAVFLLGEPGGYANGSRKPANTGC